MTKSYTRRGFTLIEVLVVVLIIAVLAAVALSQYQKAVIKSKAAHMQALLAEVVNASNLYYLNYGVYPRNFTDLDLDINLPTSTAKTCTPDLGSTVSKRGDDFEITIYGGNDTTLSDINIITAHFTTGKYKCRGFVHAQQWKNSTASYMHQTYCMEGYKNLECGTNCKKGIFCNKIMGKNGSAISIIGGQFQIYK